MKKMFLFSSASEIASLGSGSDRSREGSEEPSWTSRATSMTVSPTKSPKAMDREDVSAEADESTDAVIVEVSLISGAGGDSMDSNDSRRRRILAQTVEYDESLDEETPKKRATALDQKKSLASQLPVDDNLDEDPVPAQTKLKYADRATKLRLAHSTPTLKAQPSWLGSFRTLISTAGWGDYGPPPIEVPPVPPVPSTFTRGAPIKLSPDCRRCPCPFHDVRNHLRLGVV